MIDVLIVDDNPIVRSAIRAFLAGADDVRVVGEASDGEEAARRVLDLAPDLVLMDLRMPKLDGAGATARILDASPQTKVLILTTFELDEYVFDALRAGAAGFLVKHTEPAELVRAVHVVAAGESLLSPSVTRRLIAEEGVTALWATHIFDEITPQDHVVLLHRGRVLSDAPAAELMDGGTLPAAFLRLTGTDAETLA